MNGVAWAMELPSQSSIKNTKGLCAQLPVPDMRMFNLIDDLYHLPITYAIQSMLSVDDDWIARDDNHARLIELVKSNDLDDDVACAVVEKLNDVKLARHLAQHGKITHEVALIMVNNFLKTDITTCLSYFDSLFLRAFPEKVLGYGNGTVVYKAFVDVMTKDTWFVVDAPIVPMVATNVSMSSSKDSMPNNTMGFATMDSGKNFFVKTHNKYLMSIINLKTGVALGIAVPFKITGFSFKKDSVTSLYIVDVKRNVHEFVMPLTLLQAEMPLQQIAALVYCKVQMYKKIRETQDCIGHTLFESQDYAEEKKLINFIQKNLQDRSIPLCLKNVLRKDSEKLSDVVILRNAFNYMACTLGTTRKQVAHELYDMNLYTTWDCFHDKYQDWATNFLIQTFGGTFKALYGPKL